jgi:hypothetical protein
MTQLNNDNRLELVGLDGGNPLGFLAALGTLRTLSHAWPQFDLRMSWSDRGAQRPVIHANTSLNPAIVSECLVDSLARMRGHRAFAFADDLEISPDDFRLFAGEAVTTASARDRAWADFAAAFACEATLGEKNGKPVVQDTDFRTMSGSGHQHFLSFLRNIVNRTEAQHIYKALFEPWRYDDPVENQTMRWDPVDDQRYALRWRNPSGDPLRKQRGTMLGANRLAIESLPLFPTAPQQKELRTTGFRGTTSRDCVWTWPIWEHEASLDVVRSLLSLWQLQMLDERPTADEVKRSNRTKQIREELRALGVVAVFRSRRLTLGKFRNFTPAHAL